MKQKRDKKGRFEKKEKKCKETDSVISDFKFGVVVGGVCVASIAILISIAALFSGYAGSTYITKSITISDKMVSSDGYSGYEIVTCDGESFKVWDAPTYSKLKVGHIYTIAARTRAGYSFTEITEIVTNNDPPAAECKG